MLVLIVLVNIELNRVKWNIEEEMVLVGLGDCNVIFIVEYIFFEL